jgi:hypothetical protein
VQTEIDRLDTDYDELNMLFFDEVNSACVAIENLDDADIEKHTEMYEVQELKELEK